MSQVPPEPAADARIFRRKVFYLPGYDPFPARRYRELYRTEGAAQAKISGYDLHLARGESADWQVEAHIEARHVQTRFEVLSWSDLVQESMRASVGRTYFALLRTAYVYIASGAFRRLMWLRRGPVLAALYPIGVLLLQAFVGVLLGALVAGLISRLGVPFLPFLAQIGTLVLVLMWFRSQDRHLFAYYLMHDYDWTSAWQGAYPPSLDERLKLFTERLSEAMRSDVDEVLVIGHSSGAILALSMVARLGPVPDTGPALGLLTLGEVIPMMSFLPDAQVLRRELHETASRTDIAWVDVTAPGDACSFALVDPVAVTGVAPKNQRWPLVLSAAFTQTLSQERWESLRWRFFRLHFQYLCAFDRPGEYDYFRITAGPRTLADRFAGTSSSPSRIDAVASSYQDIDV